MCGCGLAPAISITISFYFSNAVKLPSHTLVCWDCFTGLQPDCSDIDYCYLNYYAYAVCLISWLILA